MRVKALDPVVLAMGEGIGIAKKPGDEFDWPIAAEVPGLVRRGLLEIVETERSSSPRRDK